MKILVIESSPHKKGSSNLLAQYFIQGAEEAGAGGTGENHVNPLYDLQLLHKGLPAAYCYSGEAGVCQQRTTEMIATLFLNDLEVKGCNT